MNLGLHVGDDPVAVAANREALRRALGLDAIVWLEQVHGVAVADLDAWDGREVPRADAAVVSRPGVAACVMVADCLPVLLRAPGAVAAAHAGWRGLAAGVLEATVAALCARSNCRPDALVAVLGPAIGPGHFEVGAEVREAFVAGDAGAAAAFAPGAAGKWMADLFSLARRRLAAAGLAPQAVTGGGICTVADPGGYYSFRRDGTTGRQAALAWIARGGASR